MKLLHTSDLHIGKAVNGFSLIEDQCFILDRIIDIAKAEQVDGILLAGDLYDKSAPSAEAVAVLDRFLTRIADEGIPCFGIPGNHDSAERVAYASSLLSRQGIHLSPVYEGRVSHATLNDEHGPVEIWSLPFVKPASVKPFFPDEAETIGQDYTAAVRTALEACGIDRASRNILIAHQFVTSGGASPELSDSELSLGGIDNVDVSAFDGFDYVALGHIHRGQRIGKDTVRYSGSPLKYSASEIRYPKSVTIVNMGPKGTLSIEAIPLEPMRDMRMVKGPIEDIVEAANHESATQDYIFARLTDRHPPIDALTRLRAVYPNTMGIEFERPRTAPGDPDGDAIEAEKTDPFEMFASFFLKQAGEPMTENQQNIVRNALARAFGDNAEGDRR